MQRILGREKEQALGLACGAQRALLPVAVGAMNIHYVRYATDVVRRQTSDNIIA